MKIGKLFLCVIASAAVLAGCKEKEEDLGVPKISVSESSIEFDETGGAEFARIISLNSSRDWSVAFDPEDASLNLMKQGGQNLPGLYPLIHHVTGRLPSIRRMHPNG